MDVDWGLVVKLALPAKVTRRANKVIGIYDRSHKCTVESKVLGDLEFDNPYPKYFEYTLHCFLQPSERII
jgi:hypothetical protein